MSSGFFGIGELIGGKFYLEDIIASRNNVKIYLAKPKSSASAASVAIIL